VSIVRLLAERPEFQETEQTRSLLADKLVETRVRAVVSDGATLPITISVVNGKVTLTGTTISPIASVEERVRAIPGVTEVENRIVVARSGAA
jgi:osmotically-inducible protein OsmY